MTLGEYLVGVVRAEMPASFEPEALKAQAVAARTYTLYKMQTGGNHGDTADICTDSTCCQAYISEENARNNWGENADAYEEKIETAVKALPGVKNASVSFMAQKMLLEADDDKFDAVLKDAVKAAKKVEPDFEIEL